MQDELTVGEAGLRHGVLVGARAMNLFSAVHDPYAATLKKHFSALTIGTFWNGIEPRSGEFSYASTEPIIKWGEENGLKIHGHPVFYAAPENNLQANWLADYPLNKGEAFIDRRAKNLVGHYQGRVYLWDVVNEAFEYDGSFRPSYLYRSRGESFIEECFLACHEADPNALLIYNDFGFTNARHGRKWDSIYAILRRLLDRGVPVHGLGWQMHVRDGWSHPFIREVIEGDHLIAERMQLVSDLGLKNYITELDVKGATDKEQGEVYAALMEIFLANETKGDFTTWGFTDRWDWQDNNGLPFDENYNAKPAYQEMLNVLTEGLPGDVPPTPEVERLRAEVESLRNSVEVLAGRVESLAALRNAISRVYTESNV